MTLPQINLRRVYLVARREFLGYIKTWGFWLSFLMPFMFGIFGFFASTMDFDGIEPLRYETILDETGQHAQAILDYDVKQRRANEWGRIERGLDKINMKTEEVEHWKSIHKEQGMEGVLEELETITPGFISKNKMKSAVVKSVFIDPPSATIEALKPYVIGDKPISQFGEDVQLNGALHIYEQDNRIHADYWSSNVNNDTVPSLAAGYFRELSIRQYLEKGGLSREGLNQAQYGTLEVQAFDPSKVSANGQEGQAVTIIDRIPYFVAAAATMILWLTIFSGSYMLLTSMLEEKLNKLLEMMLASTRFSEIIFGKLLGVAALTITAMLPYIAIGIGASIFMMLKGSPEVLTQFAAAFTPKLIIFFFVFLVLGYIFYGAFFVALGALAESMQDAQTLTTPIMIMLTACILVMPLGLQSPDSPILTFASWFPLSAPFAAIMRLPLDPPWWELALSAFFLFLLSVGVIWLAGRIFQYGVLSGSGVKGITGWIKRVIFRRKLEG